MCVGSGTGWLLKVARLYAGINELVGGSNRPAGMAQAYPFAGLYSIFHVLRSQQKTNTRAIYAM